MDIENEHIDEALLGKPSGGFEVPEGYFDQLQLDIIRKTADNGFSLPERYFENLEASVLDRMLVTKTIPLRTVRLTRIITGIAASLLFVSVFFIMKASLVKTPVESAEAQLNSLSEEEIVNYIDVADLNDEHIASMITASEDQTQKQVEDYLINTNVDEQLITDEL